MCAPLAASKPRAPALSAHTLKNNSNLRRPRSRKLRAARLKKLEHMGRDGKAEAEGKEKVWRVPDGVALEDR